MIDKIKNEINECFKLYNIEPNIKDNINSFTSLHEFRTYFEYNNQTHGILLSFNLINDKEEILPTIGYYIFDFLDEIIKKENNKNDKN